MKITDRLHRRECRKNIKPELRMKGYTSYVYRAIPRREKFYENPYVINLDGISLINGLAFIVTNMVESILKAKKEKDDRAKRVKNKRNETTKN